MEEIELWLRNPYDYKQGVRLYKAFGTNKSLMMMLDTGESGFNKKKLISSLSALNVQLVPEIAPIASAPAPQTPVSKLRKEVTEPDVVHVPITESNTIDDRFNDQLKGYYQQQSSTHVKLKLLYALGKSQNELQPLCFEILSIGTKIRALLLLQDEHRATGQMPEAMKTVRELAPDKQLRKLMNNRSYISKFAEDDDKREEVEKRLMENYELNQILNTNE
jgi:hypothetical protein